MNSKPRWAAPGGAPTDDSSATVRAHIKIGSMAPTGEVSSQVEPSIIRVLVDTHLYLPDMFEITCLYTADAGEKVTQEIKIGHQVEIRSGKDAPSATPLIRGEITSLEARCEDNLIYIVARGYDHSHVLQRSRRTRTFVNTKDSDIAGRVAADAKLKIEKIDETKYVHRHLAQIAQTDWDFLQARARANGFEMGVTDRKLYFRRASGTPGAVPLKGTATPPPLAFGGNLLSFRPKVSGADTLPASVEVRTWDEERTDVVVATVPVKPVTPDGGAGSGLAGAVAAVGAVSSLAGVGKAKGSAPATDAHLLVDLPVGAGADIAVAAESLARGIAERVGGTASEAEGRAFGNSAIQAGTEVQVEGVPAPFAGRWMVTNARHTFCEDEGGYFTEFSATGRNDRSLPGLTMQEQDAGADRRARGMMCGIVTNLADPAGRNRVKVRLPLLAPDFETDWVRVVQPGGNRGAVIFVPEVGDEVLVAFEWDDINRPIVIGGMRNGASTLGLGGPAVERKGETASVMRRGLVSSSGSRLAFVEIPANRTPLVEKSAIVLATALNDMGLTLDKTTGQVLLTCKPQTGRGKGQGVVTISTDGNGTVTIDSGPKGSVNVTGGNVNVRAARALNLESDGQLTLKGQNVKITGRLIELN
ncbi:VgrG-related protein [Streptomyces sp. NBC_01264]|uniref:VgrG-related protein n=1 Tax=Streptomyces sp. NBC_01264 TaxID=2903804 RepID=UPI0022567E5A|nr:VgrG-related protein [Streptomyces sp. NBC_01264]MCX4781777.1 VgrG-related protein [Streptomyces sp. NBC_01264]